MLRDFKKSCFLTQQTIMSLLAVFTEANKYSGTPKWAYYVATRNACEGSGYTLKLQCEAKCRGPQMRMHSLAWKILQTDLCVTNACLAQHMGWTFLRGCL